MTPRALWVAAVVALGCTRGSGSAGKVPVEPPLATPASAAASPVQSLPTASAAPKVVDGYGDTFPRLDAVPKGLGGTPFAKNELRLIVQPSTSAALPYTKRLAELEPRLKVIVIDRQYDKRATAWLERSGLTFIPEDPNYDIVKALDSLARDPKLGNYLADITTPWPSMAAADGVAREPEEACLFHGPWLVWIGAVSDARLPVESVARGAWSRAALDEFESIRGEMNLYAKAIVGREWELARERLKKVAARPDAAPGRLSDLAQGLIMTAQDRGELDLAQALAARAIKDTEGLDYSFVRDAGLVHHLTGDSKGAVAYAKRALAGCEEVQDDCSALRAIARTYQRCPYVLAPMPAEAAGVLVGKFTLKNKPGSPPDCK